MAWTETIIQAAEQYAQCAHHKEYDGGSAREEGPRPAELRLKRLEEDTVRDEGANRDSLYEEAGRDYGVAVVVTCLHNEALYGDTAKSIRLREVSDRAVPGRGLVEQHTSPLQRGRGREGKRGRSSR